MRAPLLAALLVSALPSSGSGASAGVSGGMLRVQESESRSIQDLNGIWRFRADQSADRHQGIRQKWYEAPLQETIDMAVPSSFNDITTLKSVRDFVGWAWYERRLFVSPDWADKRIVLRIDSAHYYAVVWLNGRLIAEHEGGHLPFEGRANYSLINWKGINRITIAVNNTLTPHTLPPGTVTVHRNSTRYPPGYIVQNSQFDFFNYAGIHRKVMLYVTPKTYVDDIDIRTHQQATSGIISYSVKVSGGDISSVRINIISREGHIEASDNRLEGRIKIDNVKLWWPYSMNKVYGYLYVFEVAIADQKGVEDVYRQKFGIRTVAFTSSKLLINNKPFYCHGAAKHEDADIRGKGLDHPLILRDFNMMKWMGINCFRTSHYPYAEEVMDQADQEGFAVIDECPGVGITKDENFSNKSLSHHLEVMRELIRRDKNRPSAIMWSVANEPDSRNPLSEHYFSQLFKLARSLDSNRLLTFVSNSHDPSSDYAAKFADIQCLNRYYGWYSDNGHTEVIWYQLNENLKQWYKKYHKPLIITEYGADTVAGLHTMPSYSFTEDYQVDFLKEYHHVFDNTRSLFLVGEMVWNFADFMTTETTSRVVGNKKGLLTRQRQPKQAAYIIRDRYWKLINSTLR